MPNLTMPEQSALVHELIDGIRADLMRDIAAGKLPESWDGIELRQLVADRFAFLCGSEALKRNKSRMKSFRNEVLIRNL